MSDKTEGNAVYHSYTPCLDSLFRKYPNTLLKAHGKAVGLPTDDDMGNSEVGHNAIGSDRYTARGKLLQKLFKPERCLKVRHGRNYLIMEGMAPRFIPGLFSDGNVHFISII